MTRPKALLSWSSGKDAAWALHSLRCEGEVEVVGLLTTTNEIFSRVAMHGVREALLEAQAEATGLPLWKVPLPWPCSNEAYEARMASICALAVAEGIEAIAFGDLFLEDVRDYRIQKLAGSGLAPLFPIWNPDTASLARDMVGAGLKATLVCVDPRVLDATFAGRDFDVVLLADLPSGVDPCGERGEFHTFAWDGPMFCHPVPVARGEVVERDGFIFADLVPA
ncbi:MAG TPA: ATP-binding protein [Polyangia bacterium]